VIKVPSSCSSAAAAVHAASLVQAARGTGGLASAAAGEASGTVALADTNAQYRGCPALPARPTSRTEPQDPAEIA
jgi:hypothetical protein